MFNSIFRKLFWKEFRTLWPLWVAVAMFYGFLSMGIYFSIDGPGKMAARNEAIFLAAAILPMLYALGSAGTQFAWELETGTFRRLRALPVSSGQAVWAKMAWTLTSTVLLAATLWGVSYLVTGGENLTSTIVWIFPYVCCFASLEAIAWGTIVSLRSRSPLIATIIAGVIGIVVSILEINLGSWGEFIARGKVGGTWSNYVAVWPVRLTVLAVLAAVIVYLGRHWFDYWRRRESRAGENDRLFGSEVSPSQIYITGDGGFLALCQQYWQRNRKLWLIVILLPVVAAICGVVGMLGTHSTFQNKFGFTLWGLLLSCIIVASNVFGTDQSDQGFRFFAHHGVSTRKVWFSRVLLSGILFSILWCIAVAIFWFIMGSEIPMRINNMPVIITIVLSYYFLSGICLFAVGAFFSIHCKSRILAWTWTMGLLVVCGMLLAFLIHCEVSLFLSLIPVFGILLCSYMGLSDKIHDRTGLRVWLKKLGLLAVCMVVFFGLFISQRVLSIPNVEINPAWIDDYKQAQRSPESERLTKDFQSLDNFKPEKVTVDRPSEWILPWDFDIEIDPITQMQSHVPAPLDGTMPIFSQSDLNKVLRIANSTKEIDWRQAINLTYEEHCKIGQLRNYLITTAEYYSRKREPEKSLDCLLAAIRLSRPLLPFSGSKAETSTMVFDLLPRWAAGEKVTPALIRKAIHAIDTIDPPSLADRRLLVGWLVPWEKIEGQTALSGYDSWMYWIYKCMPWESARFERLRRWGTVKHVELLGIWEGHRLHGAGYHNNLLELEKQIDKWIREGKEIAPLSLSWDHQFRIETIGRFWQAELFRRLALTSLAIRAYQLEHDGKLPESLRDIDKYLTTARMSMPCGPAFGFRSEGFHEKQCVQPSIRIQSREFHETLYERPSLVGDLVGKPCIALNTKTLYEAYGLFPKICPEAQGDKILNLPDREFYSIPTVYPLPFDEPKHEKEKKHKDQKKEED